GAATTTVGTPFMARRPYVMPLPNRGLTTLPASLPRRQPLRPPPHPIGRAKDHPSGPAVSPLDAPGRKPLRPEAATAHDAPWGEPVPSDAADRHHWMPLWPFCPTSIGCLTLVISVTRSAAATSSGAAFRPVTITCWVPGRSVRVLTTSSTSIQPHF